MLDTKPAPGRVAVNDAQLAIPESIGLGPRQRWRQWIDGKDGLRLLRIVVVLGLIGFVIVPIVATIVMGSRADFESLLSDPAVHDATRNSLVSSAVSALAATALGVGFAVIFERFRFPGQNLLRWLLLIPFLIPPFIGAMSWMALLGVNGPVNQLLSRLGIEQTFSIFGGTGVIFLLTIHSYPIAYLVISAAIRQVPGNLEEAARIAGASNWTVLRTVTLPLIRPGMMAAFMLTFVSSLSDFGIPALIGLPERYTTLTTLVYRQLSSPSATNPLPEVSAISMVLMAVALVAILAQRGRAHSTQMTASASARHYQTGVFGAMGMVVTWLWVIVVSALPLMALASQALLPAPGVPLTLETITLDNIVTAVTSPTAVIGIQNSVMLAAGAAGITSILGLGVALLLARSKHPINPGIDVVANLPQALPGLVIAVGWLLVAPALGIFNTPVVILVAYVMAFLALVVQQLRGPLASVSAALEEAATISGASRLRAIIGTTGRIVAPVVLTGAIMVFLTAVRELTISILLVAPGSQTLGVAIFNLQQAGNYNAASALALIVAIVGIAGLSITATVTSKRQGN
ncbi:ABC transporter permease [Yaniella halotolerans]|uniref:ABC transporter permease n=1 Tax=Yaniella halotolerans TaxID=225453 RepID=UPI0003B42269|nr:iron ABC transporter permease [Yaniella halotolerans]